MITTASCLDPAVGLPALASRSVDVAVCDPPYSAHVHAQLGREDRADGRAARAALTFAALDETTARDVAAELCRVCRRWLILFTDERSIDLWARSVEAAGGLYVRAGAWIKTDPMPQMSGDRPAAGTESIVICHAPRLRGEGRMRWHGHGRPATYRGSTKDPGERRRHPCAKPLWLLRAILADFTDRGETVIDPFCGSGSTGVAALHLGRHFRGWEIDPRMADVARARLAGVREQTALPFGEAA